MNISQKLASFAAELKYENIPENIRKDVNRRIVDYTASAAAGYKINRPACDVVLKTLKLMDASEQSSVFFSEEKLSAEKAAFYNAFVANSADMDDGHMLANGHPGITVISPVLAIAEWKDIPYEQTAEAIITGYECFLRIAQAIMPESLARGFNCTGTVGTLASAIASAKVLGLNAEQIHVALGLAATGACGLMELNESGQEMKPVTPAYAASRGIICALLSMQGAVGPLAPLDGSKGFFKAFTDVVKPEAITDGLGEKYLMDSTYFKLYPACRHMHAMIDCAAIVRGMAEFTLSDVEKATLYTYPNSEKLTGSIRHPKSGAEAKFSLTYSTAVALESGGYSLDDLTSEEEKSADLVKVINRMEIVVDPSLENRAQMLRGGRLSLELKDGRTFDVKVDVPKGEKQFPVDDSDLRRKLSACGAGIIDESNQDAVYEAGLNFEKIDSIRDYFLLLS